MKTHILVGFVLLAFAGCASYQPPFHPCIGVPEFQQWCRLALRHPNDNQYYRQFYLAYHGDPAALHAYFIDALKQSETPYIDCEASEGLWWTLETLLARRGDERFATALTHEKSRVQSAVVNFFDERFLPQYPKTRKVIETAPNIDFPLNQAQRRN